MIVVTTPTGQIGSKVITELIAGGADVRVVTRDENKLTGDVREAVQVVIGSHGDAAIMTKALEGADALFWIVPPDSTKTLEAAWLDFTRPAADAIRSSGIKHVVGVTALGRGTRLQDKAGLVTASIAMDDLLMSTGAAFRGLAIPSLHGEHSPASRGDEGEGHVLRPDRPGKETRLHRNTRHCRSRSKPSAG